MEFKMISFEELLIDSTRNGISKPKSTRGSGVPMINMGELFKYDRIPSLENLELVPLTVSEIDRFILKEEDLLFARRSLTLEGAGKCSIYLNSKEATFESSIIRARIDKSKANPQFYYYYFNSQTGKALIQSIAEQVAVAGIRGSDLKKLKVHFVDREIQDKIVHIMSAIDNKIEMNSKIISNLEEIAQTLFKRWFVEFEFPNEDGEPYKSSGGKMIENKKGEIPSDWELTELSSITSHAKITFNPSKEKVEQVAHFSLPAYDKQGYPSFELTTSIKSNKYFINEHSVLFSKMNPITPRVWFPNINKNKKNICSSEFIVLDTSLKSNKSFVYSLVKSEQFTNFLINNATGSTGSRQRVIPTTAMTYSFSYNEEISVEFDELIKPFHEKALILREEIQDLISLRDTLLPKLLSGEIELPDETEVTEHVSIP